MLSRQSSSSVYPDLYLPPAIQPRSHASSSAARCVCVAAVITFSCVFIFLITLHAYGEHDVWPSPSPPPMSPPSPSPPPASSPGAGEASSSASMSDGVAIAIIIVGGVLALVGCFLSLVACAVCARRRPAASAPLFGAGHLAPGELSAGDRDGYAVSNGGGDGGEQVRCSSRPPKPGRIKPYVQAGGANEPEDAAPPSMPAPPAHPPPGHVTFDVPPPEPPDATMDDDDDVLRVFRWFQRGPLPMSLETRVLPAALRAVGVAASANQIGDALARYGAVRRSGRLDLAGEIAIDCLRPLAVPTATDSALTWAAPGRASPRRRVPHARRAAPAAR